jgi:hypothetical protein
VIGKPLAHLCDLHRRRATQVVCGAHRPPIILTSIVDLIAHDAPCPRCLEWVVEQGQLASRRLEESDTTREPQA